MKLPLVINVEDLDILNLEVLKIGDLEDVEGPVSRVAERVVVGESGSRAEAVVDGAIVAGAELGLRWDKVLDVCDKEVGETIAVTCGH